MTPTMRDFEPKDVRFVWGQRIPRGMVSAVGGMPGQRKSLLAWHIAAEVSQEEAVVMLPGEEAMSELARPRAEAAGADMGRVVPMKGVLLPEDAEKVETEVARVGAGLVIIDPVGDHVSSGLRDDQTSRRALRPLIHMAEKHDCAVLLVAHLLKDLNPKVHPLKWFAGSGAGMAAIARTAFILHEDPSEPSTAVLACVKPGVLGTEPKSLAFRTEVKMIEGIKQSQPYLEALGETDLTVYDLAPGSRQGTTMAELKRVLAHNFLKEILSGKPVPKHVVYEKGIGQGISKAMLESAAGDLGIVKESLNGVSKWSLPKAA